MNIPEHSDEIFVDDLRQRRAAIRLYERIWPDGKWSEAPDDIRAHYLEMARVVLAS